MIDMQTGTMYVVVRTKENGQFFQRLHALDVTTVRRKFGGPTVIKAKVKGCGDGAVNGFVHFDSLRNNQRTGLLLVNGLIYIAWASHCDIGPYHGWVMSYDARTLKQNAVWNSTPNAGLGGVWLRDPSQARARICTRLLSRDPERYPDTDERVGTVGCGEGEWLRVSK